MKASVLSFRAAVLLLIAGIAWGISMAMTGDHSAMPAHAHLNLLGWVSLFLFGVYYRLHPALEKSKVAIIQLWVWILGTLVLVTGVALIFMGKPVGEPMAGVGSLIVLADALLFAWLVYRS